MKIIKKINNNVALAESDNEKEIVVFGKGIGFHSMPYELKDLSIVKRVFYDIKSNYFALAGSLPEEIILLSSDIAELAKSELKCELNPNMPFTLADHLNFAIERAQKGLVVTTPLAYDVEHLYPREVDVGIKALDMLEKQIHVRLPGSEKISIALHLINAELETDDMHITMMATGIIRDVTNIVEKSLGIQLEKTSFNYSRFTMHLRYLVNRIMKGEQKNNDFSPMLKQFRREYKDIYACTQKVVRYFSEKWHWDCSEDETFYLFIHIHRVRESSL